MAPEQPGQALLHIELREGFADHTVAIIVDGREVFHRSGVRTDAASGRAGVLDVACAPGVVRLAIAVDPGDRVATVELELARLRNVSVSLVGAGTVSIDVPGGRSGLM